MAKAPNRASFRPNQAITIKYSIRFLILVVCIQFLLCDVQCQFFTKSSKSIPRMGRRSLPDAANKLDIYRRMVIDRLVDEFGPDLLTQLRPEAKTTGPEVERSRELFARNEQPFDANTEGLTTINGFQHQQIGPAMDRNERSSGDSQIIRQNNRGANSLAMRAFNADRLLQYLASGGSPVMPFSGPVEPKEQRVSYTTATD